MKKSSAGKAGKNSQKKSNSLIIIIIAVAVVALLVTYLFSGGSIMDLITGENGAASAADTEPAPGIDSKTDKPDPSESSAQPTGPPIDENGRYFSKDEVALYIHTYGKLPANFVTKTEARKKGWEGGSVEKYFPGCAIGGDSFGNSEGNLPEKSGRTYRECDIDTNGQSSRGAKRIVFSNDGLVYYTGDHYETFELLYGTP